MAWTYSGDPSSNPKDEVRYLIGDTEQDMPLLQDEEITYSLSKNNQVARDAALTCLRSIMAKVAKQVDESTGPLKINASQRYYRYRSLYNDLLGMDAAYQGAPDGASSAVDGNNTFRIGLHDNP
jgi:hypothetical protein